MTKSSLVGDSRYKETGQQLGKVPLNPSKLQGKKPTEYLSVSSICLNQAIVKAQEVIMDTGMI